MLDSLDPVLLPCPQCKSVITRMQPVHVQCLFPEKVDQCTKCGTFTSDSVVKHGGVSSKGTTCANGCLFADAQFFWGSIMYGYLLYDTAFTLLFYTAVGSVTFLLHHALGLVCCCFGLYFNKMMLFGTAIMVFFEGTTPLLHLLGCLKLMGRDGSPVFAALGETTDPCPM